MEKRGSDRSGIGAPTKDEEESQILQDLKQLLRKPKLCISGGGEQQEVFPPHSDSHELAEPRWQESRG